MWWDDVSWIQSMCDYSQWQRNFQDFQVVSEFAMTSPIEKSSPSGTIVLKISTVNISFMCHLCGPYDYYQ